MDIFCLRLHSKNITLSKKNMCMNLLPNEVNAVYESFITVKQNISSHLSHLYNDVCDCVYTLIYIILYIIHILLVYSELLPNAKLKRNEDLCAAFHMFIVCFFSLPPFFLSSSTFVKKWRLICISVFCITTVQIRVCHCICFNFFP